MTKTITFKEAAFIFVTMLGIIGVSVIYLGLSPIVPIILTLALLILWGKWRRHSWQNIHDGIQEGVATGIIPMLIFLLIGALIASWIAAGIIPAMMVVGFKLVNVNYFIPSAFVVCAIIGTSIGSAFTTASTVGLALMGMGISLGFNPALLAGAIISGAVFGDKMSPLSDTTNLAAAVAGTDLFKHIKNMMWTTVPAFILSLILFFILGNQTHATQGTAEINLLIDTLKSEFHIGWFSAIPILLMVGSSLLKMPAIATLLLNISVSIGLYVIQSPSATIKQIATIIEQGFVAETGVENLDALLSRGGLNSMLGSIALILLTLSLGGLLMKFGIIEALMAPLAERLTSPTSLISATVIGGILANVLIGEQYLSIILPGKAMKPSFDKSSLDPTALSRALEDSGTVFNTLIPWGVSGVFMAATLGVPTLVYLPFCFFNLLSPILSIASGVTGIGLSEKDPIRA
ncbi:Na+/H+ antiporter NhaC [Vagococcus lutrae]|uniref:Na+/H+ antiporter NhaC n=1 Tax=Vagococcus lutrae TaxID=81947 RepID=UPI002010461A|nr:Na+/H+ antiporter NhaC [Vagococcus lutrae]UQF70830.1 Na+/H+ antiporter NhaC [Vagococcus lutrae]